MGRGYGYTPRTVPTPLFIAVGLALFIILMYLMLFFVWKKTSPAGTKSPGYYETSIPYYEAPPATQAVPPPNRPWWVGTLRREEEFRQDAYEAFQRQEFDTDRELDKIERDKEFFRMKRSVTKF